MVAALAMAVILCTNDSNCSGISASSSGSAQSSKNIKNDSSTTSTDDDPTALPTAFLVELRKLLPSDHIEEDIEALKQRGKPWNSYHRLASYPRIIVSPSTTEEVSTTTVMMSLCHRYILSVLMITYSFDTNDNTPF